MIKSVVYNTALFVTYLGFAVLLGIAIATKRTMEKVNPWWTES